MSAGGDTSPLWGCSAGKYLPCISLSLSWYQGLGARFLWNANSHLKDLIREPKTIWREDMWQDRAEIQQSVALPTAGEVPSSYGKDNPLSSHAALPENSQATAPLSPINSPFLILKPSSNTGNTTVISTAAPTTSWRIRMSSQGRQ